LGDGKSRNRVVNRASHFQTKYKTFTHYVWNFCDDCGTLAKKRKSVGEVISIE